MLNSKSRQKQKKSRQEINDASWALKRKRKRKGLPSGSRFNYVNDERLNSNGQNLISTDPRIGSKKPISLTLDENDKQERLDAVSEIENSSKSITTQKKQRTTQSMLAAEQELQQLENDPQLETLLDMTEKQERLTDEQSDYLERKLNRISELMLQLGYSEADFDDVSDFVDEQTEKKEDIVGLLKRK